MLTLEKANGRDLSLVTHSDPSSPVHASHGLTGSRRSSGIPELEAIKAEWKAKLKTANRCKSTAVRIIEGGECLHP